MKQYKIAVIPGDGIGPEVLREGINLGYKEWGRKVLEAIEQVMVEAKCLTPDMGGRA